MAVRNLKIAPNWVTHQVTSLEGGAHTSATIRNGKTSHLGFNDRCLPQTKTLVQKEKEHVDLASSPNGKTQQVSLADCTEYG